MSKSRRIVKEVGMLDKIFCFKSGKYEMDARILRIFPVLIRGIRVFRVSINLRIFA